MVTVALSVTRDLVSCTDLPTAEESEKDKSDDDDKEEGEDDVQRRGIHFNLMIQHLVRQIVILVHQLHCLEKYAWLNKCVLVVCIMAKKYYFHGEIIFVEMP